MKVLFFSAKKIEIPYFDFANHMHLDIHYTMHPLSLNTVHMTQGFEYISVFTADDVSEKVIELLHLNGVKYIAARSTGYDHIDLDKAKEVGIHVANVPEYSPFSIAEHTVALILALSRKIVTAHAQVHQQNFTLDNLIGFDLNGKTVGIIGTGRIGSVSAKILHGFGCRLLGYDIRRGRDLEVKYDLKYSTLSELCVESDIIVINCALNDQTRYLIDEKMFGIMKRGVMIVNTARGAVVNTKHLITYLDKGIVGSYGMDVYEHERGIFFYDHSGEKLHDAILENLLARKNVLITPHQAFATHEALMNIADATFYNILEWNQGLKPENELTNFAKVISASYNKM